MIKRFIDWVINWATPAKVGGITLMKKEVK